MTMGGLLKPVLGAALGLILANVVLAQLPPDVRRRLGA